MNAKPLIPIADAKWVPARNPAYDPFLDEVLEVILVPHRWHMTRWQMLLVGCGIQPDRFDAVNRIYGPNTKDEPRSANAPGPQ